MENKPELDLFTRLGQVLLFLAGMQFAIMVWYIIKQLIR